MVAFNINPNCLRCIGSKTSCPLALTINGVHPHPPYSMMLGKRLLAWQIYRFMKNDPVYMHYFEAEDQSLHPGVEKATLWTPFTQDQRGRWRDELSEKAASAGEGDWKKYWYGVPYEDAREVHRREASRNAQERQSVQGLLIDMNEPLPDDILEVLDQYYAALRDVMGQKGWTGGDVLKRFNVIPWSTFDISEEPRQEIEEEEEADVDVELEGSVHDDAAVEIDEEGIFGEDPDSGSVECPNPPSTPQRRRRESAVDEEECSTTPRRRYENPPTGEGMCLWLARSNFICPDITLQARPLSDDGMDIDIPPEGNGGRSYLCLTL